MVREELKGGLVSSRAFNPSETIVLEVAKRIDMNPVDLPPLYDSVDPEALDRLIQGQGSIHLTFEYAGYEVTVSETDCIVIHERESNHS